MSFSASLLYLRFTTLLSLWLMFQNCTEEKNEAVEFSTALSRTLEDRMILSEMYNFTIPSSVHPKNVVAVYYTIEPKSHVVIAFTDSTRTVAKKVVWWKDSVIAEEPLSPIKFSEFRDLRTKEEYVVRPYRVSIFLMSFSGNVIREEVRVDVIDPELARECY